MGVTIEGLADAASVLGEAVLGPAELATALGFDPLAVLTPAERAAVATRAVLARRARSARARRRVPRPARPARPDGPAHDAPAGGASAGGLDPRVHKGVGYLLRDEWTIDAQPFATAGDAARRAGGSCGVTPLPATLNRRLPRAGRGAGGARADASGRPAPPQRASRSPGTRSSGSAPATSACWRAPGTGRAARATTAGSPRSASSAPQGLGVIAYSRAVRFGTLGVCPQR